MRALKCLLIILSLLLVSSPAPIVAQDSHQSVGLVLSGGGAKGIAHIGAIQALEDNDIPIDYITGTSMGAIIGGLYAAGYTTEEMLALIKSEYFGYMASGRIDPAFTYYFSADRPSPQMFSFPLGRRDTTAADRFDPQSLISPAPMAFGFMEIYGSATAQCHGNFNKLFVPYRSVSSDMTHRRSHVFSSGYLPDAVRASMSFPLVFQAVEIDGNVYYDGGIYDNFPVDVMRREFAPSVMVGIDVSASSTGPQNSFMDQLELLVMNPQTYDLPEAEGVKVRVNLNDYSLLDWGAAEAIYQRGYDRTMEMMDSIKTRIHTRIPAATRRLKRAVYKAQTPPLRFAEVTVEGGTKHQNEYLANLFTPRGDADTIGIDRARLAFYRALASDKFKTLRPKASLLNDTSDLFRLNIETTVKSKFDVGLGAYITSSNNSFLYFRGGYSALSQTSINTNIEAWIGQSYMAGAFNASIYMHTHVPSAFRFQLVASRRRYFENEKLFFRDNEPSFVIGHEYFGKMSWAMAVGRQGAIDVGLGGGRIYNTFYQNSNPDSYLAGRDNIKLDLAQAFISYGASTLDNYNYPTQGASHKAAFQAVAGRSHYYAATKEHTTSDGCKWLQAQWRGRDYFNLGKHWSLGVESQAVLSTRGLLPSYYASISSAPAYAPTPASENFFDPKLRANSFLALAAVPVYKYSSSLSARLSMSAFAPLRTIIETPGGGARYGEWFGSLHFFGELDAVYSLPFADICVYCNYATTRSKFNVGISFGLYIDAPSFLKL